MNTTITKSELIKKGTPVNQIAAAYEPGVSLRQYQIQAKDALMYYLDNRDRYDITKGDLRKLQIMDEIRAIKAQYKRVPLTPIHVHTHVDYPDYRALKEAEKPIATPYYLDAKNAIRILADTEKLVNCLFSKKQHSSLSSVRSYQN